MRTTSDNLIIEMPEQGEYDEHKGSGLLIPTRYRRFEKDVVTQEGTVAVPPKQRDISEGDLVHVHHFAQEPQRRLKYEDRELASVLYDEVYCRVVDGRIEAVGQWNLLKPIEAEEAPIQDPDRKWEPLKATVEVMSKEMEGSGVDVGDIVAIRPEREYEIIVEGETYYRVRSKDIIAVHK